MHTGRRAPRLMSHDPSPTPFARMLVLILYFVTYHGGFVTYSWRIVKSFAFLSRISTKQIGEQCQLAADTLRGNPLEGLALGGSLGGACSGGIPRRGLLWGNASKGLALGESLGGAFLRGHPSYLVGACFSMGDGGIPRRGLLNRKGGPSLSLSLSLTLYPYP